MDMGSVGAAITSLNAAVGITRAMKDLHDAAQINGKVAELTGSIIDIQQKMLAALAEQGAMQSRIQELEGELAGLRRTALRFARYKMIELPNKKLVYVLKSEFREEEPAHYACPVCFGKQRTVIMQHTPHRPKRETIIGSREILPYIQCVECGYMIVFSDLKYIEPNQITT